MSMVGLALMLALAARDPLPPKDEAADALLSAMMCKDEDGFTLCDPSMPVEIEFSRFDCVAEPVLFAGEAARATCRIAGRVRYTARGVGQYRWVPLPGDHADFWLPDSPGARWQAFSGPHLGRVPG